MIAATIYLSRGVQSLKHMFFVIVRAVLLSERGIRGDGGSKGAAESGGTCSGRESIHI